MASENIVQIQNGIDYGVWCLKSTKVIHLTFAVLVATICIIPYMLISLLLIFKHRGLWADPSEKYKDLLKALKKKQEENANEQARLQDWLKKKELK